MDRRIVKHETFFQKQFRFVFIRRELEVIELQTVEFYTVDLTRIKGKGELKCPKCGVRISPDDRTETAYIILEPVMKEGHLEKIVLQCNSCGSYIHLIGFHILNEDNQT
jgi:DNA-directed RNA polymerase subunit RPC12/RpoP